MKQWKCQSCGTVVNRDLRGPTGGGAGPRCGSCGGVMLKARESQEAPHTPQEAK